MKVTAAIAVPQGSQVQKPGQIVGERIQTQLLRIIAENVRSFTCFGLAIGGNRIGVSPVV